MEERLLKFAHIVEAGGFTRAAQQIHISQPALTTAVQKLERELGAELIVRGSRSFTLTEAGTVAYASAKAMQSNLQNLHVQLAHHTGQKPSVRLGMIDSLADMLFVHGSALKPLEERTRLSLTVDNSSRLLGYVSEDALDLALIAQPKRLPASVTAEHIGNEPLVFVAHPADVALLRRQLRAKHLQHFLSYNQGSRTNELVMEHFAQIGMSATPKFYSTSPEIMLQLVLAQRGAAVLPYLLVRSYVTSGELTRLSIQKNPILTRQIIAIRRKGRQLESATAVLLTEAENQLHMLTDEISTRGATPQLDSV